MDDPMNLPPVVCLMGPTASGKTTLAMALHGQLPVDIINVDASQVYRGLDIGTAKPSPAELLRVPHRLIDIRDPAQPYSAAEFCTDARREIGAIHAAGRLPLLVGGSMFYFRALEQGLSELPSANPAIRSRLNLAAERDGWPALHALLARQDPASAARIKPNDAQRIQRALEVLELTGRPMNPATPVAPSLPAYRFIKLAIYPAERSLLHQRIAQRYQAMLASGLVEEVERLMQRTDLTPDLPAMRTVGYRQVIAYLRGTLSYQEMIEKGIIATRQLAKRQLTWLRADRELHRLEAHDPVLLRSALDYLATRVHV
jgi:tRNA dimethylallyltransferase